METSKRNKAPFQLMLNPELKKALEAEAKKENRSLTNYILVILAEKIGWEGDI